MVSDGSRMQAGNCLTTNPAPYGGPQPRTKRHEQFGRRPFGVHRDLYDRRGRYGAGMSIHSDQNYNDTIGAARFEERETQHDRDRIERERDQHAATMAPEPVKRSPEFLRRLDELDAALGRLGARGAAV